VKTTEIIYSVTGNQG